MIGEYGLHDVAALALVVGLAYVAIRVSLWFQDRHDRHKHRP